MGIEISQVHAKLGVERIPSKLEMRSQRAQLELRQEHAKIRINTELPRVEIDQSECFASAGLKKPIDLSRELAQMAQQQVLEYIGKIASDGDMLAAIEQGGNPIADIAERDSYVEHEFNIDFIPKAKPKITVTGGIEINADENPEGSYNWVEGNYIPGNLNISYTPEKLRIYMEQYNQVKFKYKGNTVDMYS